MSNLLRLIITTSSKKWHFTSSITNEFEYEDTPQNTKLSYATPKEVIVFPSNIVSFAEQSLRDCQNTLVNFSFSPNSRLLNFGLNQFKDFTKLFSVDLSNCKSLQSISKNCFESSTLKVIILPEDGSLITLSSGSFAKTQISKIKIPKTVQYISGWEWGSITYSSAFDSCRSLAIFEIPNDSELKHIGYQIFGLSRVTEIFIPKYAKVSTGGITNVETLRTINLHENNTQHKLYRGILYTYDYSSLIACPGNYSDKIEIHPNCTTLELDSFMLVTTFFDLVIPSTVKTLKTSAFLRI